MNKLDEALIELNDLLKKHKLRVEIIICGAFAIEMQGLDLERRTLDVDSACELPPYLDGLIHEVAIKLGLTRNGEDLWLNDKASRVTLPENLRARAKPIKKWSNIDASVVDRRDLISMKVSAFFTRRDTTTKDLEDLKILSPTESELFEAIEFARKANYPPEGSSKKIRDEFNESENDVKRIFIKK